MALQVNVAAQEINETDDEAAIDIIFTNTAAYTPATGNIYYMALLTDSTPETALTRSVTFSVAAVANVEVPANTPKEFIIDNTTELVFPITASLGKIVYH